MNTSQVEEIGEINRESNKEELTGQHSERSWAPIEQLSATPHSASYERSYCVELSATANYEVATRRRRLSSRRSAAALDGHTWAAVGRHVDVLVTLLAVMSDAAALHRESVVTSLTDVGGRRHRQCSTHHLSLNQNINTWQPIRTGNGKLSYRLRLLT